MQILQYIAQYEYIDSIFLNSVNIFTSINTYIDSSTRGPPQTVYYLLMCFALKAGSDADRQIWIHSVGIGRLQVHGTSGMFVTSHSDKNSIHS